MIGIDHQAVINNNFVYPHILNVRRLRPCDGSLNVNIISPSPYSDTNVKKKAHAPGYQFLNSGW